MAKRKLKKDLEVEILSLKKDIYNLVMDVPLYDKEVTRASWVMSFKQEKMFMFGDSNVINK